MEEYISHVDYKQMMENFKKGTPKNLLKEMHTMKHDGAGEFQHLNATKDEGLEKEGNAFTAGLAKTKKGGEFKVGDKAVKDTSSYDAPMEESGTGDEPFADFYKNAIESASGDKISHTEEDDYGRVIYWGTKDPNVSYYIGDNHKIMHYNGETGKTHSIGSINDYDEPMPDYEPDTDADYEEPRDDFDMAGGDFNDGEFWEAEVKKMQEIAGVKPQDDGPEDDDDEAREKRAKKAEMDDEEAENAERDIDEEAHADGSHMRDPDTAAKTVAEKHGAELKPLYDKYQVAWEQYIKDVNNKELSKAYNALVKEFQNDAINWCGHEMLEAGMKRVQVSNLLSGYGYFEDWLSDYITAIGKELKGMAEGLNMPPLQATGQTIITNEDQAPFGMSVLSPDERKQLKEFINSYRTIKSEISKLLEKAGKSGRIMEGKEEDEAIPAARPAHYNEPTRTPKHKSSNLGGNRTGLVMTKAEMWENEEGEHERIESMLDTKLHDAFHKVTGMIMKDLMADGFDEGDIKNFLQHEIEEKAKEAVMSQHDF
jgi:hypothetical protein